MQVEAELSRLSPDKDMALTIGVFDGVHLGHKYLLSQLKERARQDNWLSGVVTFNQHPQAVLSPQTKLPSLTSLTQRIKLLKEEGIDAVVTLSFTHELAQLGTRQFVALLKKYLRMRGLVIGPDFALGKNREGDINTLRSLRQEMGFNLTVVLPLSTDDGIVSSTAIRNALAIGDMKRVHSMIGRPFSLQGQIVAGAGRGTELGFPTANLEVDPQQALPPDGVYATWTYIDDSVYESVTNIGRRPTFGTNERMVEVYVLEYQGDLYGRELKVDVIERLRAEQRFDTADELKQQMAEDVKQGRAILDSTNIKLREQVKK